MCNNKDCYYYVSYESLIKKMYYCRVCLDKLYDKYGSCPVIEGKHSFDVRVWEINKIKLKILDKFIEGDFL